MSDVAGWLVIVFRRPKDEVLDTQNWVSGEIKRGGVDKETGLHTWYGSKPDG